MTVVSSKTTRRIASELADAIGADMKPEAGGFDLAAGMFGPAVSALLVKLAADLDQQAIAIDRAKAVLGALAGYSAFDATGTEADEGYVKAKADAAGLRKELAAGPVLPDAVRLETVDSLQLTLQLRRRGLVPSVWSVADLEFLDDDEATQGLSDEQLAAVKESLLDQAAGRLVDSLSTAGNELLSAYWGLEKSALVAQTLADSSPTAGSEGREVLPAETARGG